MSVQEPTKESYLNERQRLEKSIERDEKIERIIAAIPVGEPNRDKIVDAIKQASRYDANFSIVTSYADFQVRRPDQPALTINATLTKPGFFTDPENIKTFGEPTLKRARAIIIEQTKPVSSTYCLHLDDTPPLTQLKLH